MKNNIRKICCLLITVVFVGSVPLSIVKASGSESNVQNEDEIVLTVNIGNNAGELKYSDNMQGEEKDRKLLQ